MIIISWYFNYYAGYRDNKTGILFPIGPFDHNGKIHPIIWRSRSFESELHEMFHSVGIESVSPELKSALWPESEDEDIEKFLYLSYLPVKELPDTKLGVKTGYYLTDEIARYLKYGYSEDIFYDYMDPTEYSMRLSNELIFSQDPIQDDDEEKHSVKDYSYFSYVDTLSMDYEVSEIKTGLDIFEFTKIPDDCERVVILNEG